MNGSIATHNVMLTHIPTTGATHARPGRNSSRSHVAEPVQLVAPDGRVEAQRMGEGGRHQGDSDDGMRQEQPAYRRSRATAR
ncbi:hypothetical protein A0130_08175 [Leifsonia xyli]|nr:hypothetical protein A0130_08175 [Leifsonia xyli]